MTETAGIAARARWPLAEDQLARVRQLGELIRRMGTARFLEVHLVRADQRDFPEPWEPTLRALYALLYRLYWHAHVDVDVAVADVRVPVATPRTMLSTSSIDLLEAREGKVAYQVAAIGNDDVAGLLSHTIGDAFLRMAPGDPFRASTTTPTAIEASIAACYLGLGVVVANASMYRRSQSRQVGREVHSESKIETTGGLDIGDATLLLAVQLVVRDDVPDAVATLHGAQKDWVDRWIEALDPHEDELRELLALADAPPGTLPDRADQPRAAPAIAEPPPPKRNAGRISFRIPVRRSRVWAGTGVGVGGMLLAVAALGPGVINLVPLGVAALAGVLIRRSLFKCSACSQLMPTELAICPTCGVSLPETLATREQQAARRAEFAAQAEAEDPDLAAEAEAAYHPDA
jgi:hypothetical protein